MIRFVTGTGTGVGKTVSCIALVRAEQAAGRVVRYCKPVQTGVAAGEPGDADVVHAATGVEVYEPARFADPLAPAVAAALAGTTIDLRTLADTINGLDPIEGTLLVEGAGGILVPLTETATMADLAARLDAEVVVVTTAALGTLNHTALTLETAHARGLRVAGLVVAMLPGTLGVTEETNLERLSALAPVLGVVPVVADPAEARLGPLPIRQPQPRPDQTRPPSDP